MDYYEEDCHYPATYFFADELRLIQDKKLREKVVEIINKRPIKNIEGPASSTGKYHPFCSNGQYGLCYHTKLVVKNVATLIEAFPCSAKRADNLFAAALLHDFCKYSSNEDRYIDNDHAHKMAIILKTQGLKAVARLVDSHMGRWNHKINSPVPKKWDEKLLHIADLLASQRYINASFGEDHKLID
jgi:hypothetical protein